MAWLTVAGGVATVALDGAGFCGALERTGQKIIEELRCQAKTETQQQCFIVTINLIN